jgi:hypothetical protein
MKKYAMQLIFGLPILYFSIACVVLDSLEIIDVNKFGYAFIGGLIGSFMQYYFRKSPPSIE